MPVTTTALARARENAAAVLDEFGMETYLFSIEPQDSGWVLQVECAGDGVWETISLPVPEAFLASEDDSAAQAAVRETWRRRLSVCRMR